MYTRSFCLDDTLEIQFTASEIKPSSLQRAQDDSGVTTQYQEASSNNSSDGSLNQPPALLDASSRPNNIRARSNTTGSMATTGSMVEKKPRGFFPFKKMKRSKNNSINEPVKLVSYEKRVPQSFNEYEDYGDEDDDDDDDDVVYEWTIDLTNFTGKLVVQRKESLLLLQQVDEKIVHRNQYMNYSTPSRPIKNDYGVSKGMTNVSSSLVTPNSFDRTQQMDAPTSFSDVDSSEGEQSVSIGDRDTGDDSFHGIDDHKNKDADIYDAFNDENATYQRKQIHSTDNRAVQALAVHSPDGFSTINEVDNESDEENNNSNNDADVTESSENSHFYNAVVETNMNISDTDEGDEHTDTFDDNPAPSMKSVIGERRGKDAFKALARRVMVENSFATNASSNSDDSPRRRLTSEDIVVGGSPMQNLKGNWGKVLMLAAMRKHLPKNNLRERRNAIRNTLYKGNSTPPAVDASNEMPTTLHSLCADVNVSLSAFQACLQAHPEDVQKRDNWDRYPLHILGDNDALLGSNQGRQVASAMAIALMQAYPEALTHKDAKGHFPFISLIVDWVLWVYESHKRGKKKAEKAINAPARLFERMTGDRMSIVNASIDFFGNNGGQSGGHNSTGHNSNGSGSGGHSHHYSSHHRKSHRSNHRASTNSDTSSRHWNEEFEEDKSTAASRNKRYNLLSYSSRAFPQVELWDEVDWCLSMLTHAFDELGGCNGGLHKARKRALVHHTVKDRAAREEIVRHVVATNPTLLKTVLLLEQDGEATRNRLLRTSLFRRMLLCPESVGVWLSSMLRRKGLPCKCAVDYLQMVSQTTPEDLVGAYRTILSSDIDAFQLERSRVFEEVEKLEGIVASLVTLDVRETERAATTAVVWYVMSKILGRPFVVALIMIDFVLHITLMLAFRNDVQFIGSADNSAVGDVPTQVVIFICSHHFLRKACEALSLWSISPKIFRSYFANVWTFFDLVAIILALVAIVWNDNNPAKYREGFNAFVVGLLWIKVLGFLKVVNREMSTFILALIQILSDMRYFAVVLSVVIFMFGDMMRIALGTKDDGFYCLQNEAALSGPSQDFCGDNFLASYLRVYSLLLGDFELDDYKESDGITVLFVLFTLIGVVILLNVLIAVISDSYEKAKIKSLNLFGSARVTFVAQNEALESFLRPGTNPMEIFSNSKGLAREKLLLCSLRIGRWLVLIAIIATAFAAEMYLVTRAYELVRSKSRFFVLACIFMLCIILTIALWVVISFTVDAMARAFLPDRLLRVFDYLNNSTCHLVNNIAGRLFGLNEMRHLSSSKRESREIEDEWMGRMTYLERQMEKIVSCAKDDLTQELHNMTTKLNQTSLALQMDGHNNNNNNINN